MKPQYEPKTREQHYGYLIEECGEVLAAAGKTLRWGELSYNPEIPVEQRETNVAWLRREISDLKGAINRMESWLWLHHREKPSATCICHDTDANCPIHGSDR